MEITEAPICCQKSLERIHDILDAANCLEEVIAVSPSLTKPRAKMGVLGLLWGLASGIWSWRKNRKLASKLLEPIIQNRIFTIIDLEIVQHSRSNQLELEKKWRNMHTEFQR